MLICLHGELHRVMLQPGVEEDGGEGVGLDLVTAAWWWWWMTSLIDTHGDIEREGNKVSGFVVLSGLSRKKNQDQSLTGDGESTVRRRAALFMVDREKKKCVWFTAFWRRWCSRGVAGDRCGVVLLLGECRDAMR
jgi:hypothetical protein